MSVPAVSEFFKIDDTNLCYNLLSEGIMYINNESPNSSRPLSKMPFHNNLVNKYKASKTGTIMTKNITFSIPIDSTVIEVNKIEYSSINNKYVYCIIDAKDLIILNYYYYYKNTRADDPDNYYYTKSKFTKFNKNNLSAPYEFEDGANRGNIYMLFRYDERVINPKNTTPTQQSVDPYPTYTKEEWEKRGGINKKRQKKTKKDKKKQNKTKKRKQNKYSKKGKKKSYKKRRRSYRNKF